MKFQKANVMMKYPIGIQSFDRIREDGYVYVDKTALIYNLVKVCGQDRIDLQFGEGGNDLLP